MKPQSIATRPSMSAPVRVYGSPMSSTGEENPGASPADNRVSATAINTACAWRGASAPGGTSGRSYAAADVAASKRCGAAIHTRAPSRR